MHPPPLRHRRRSLHRLRPSKHIQAFLYREIGNGTLNGTQFNGNKRKQLEFVNITSTNQVVSVLYYCIQIYLKLLKFGTRFGTREPTCANFFGTY